MAKPADPRLGTFGDDQLARALSGFGWDDFLVLPFLSLNGTILDLRRRTETARKVIVELNGVPHLLKELPWYCSSASFAGLQTSFQLAIREEGVPTSQLLAALDGRPFFHDRFSGSIFTLQTFVQGGRSWTGELADAGAAGRLTADLHRAVRSRVIHVEEPTRTVFESAAALVELLPQARGIGSTLAVQSLMDASAAAIAVEAKAAQEAGYGLTAHLVHGDLNPFNLIFAEDRAEVVAVIDFDNVCLDEPAHDLAEALIRFGWVRYRGLSSAYGQVPTDFDVASVRSLLAGYRGRQPAPVPDEHLAAAMVAVAVELGAIGVLSGYYGEADLEQLTKNAQTLPRLARDVLAEVDR